VLLKPGTRAINRARVKIKYSPYSSNELNIQLVFISVYPFFLLWRCHSHPEHIRLNSVDLINHQTVIFFTEFRLERGVNKSLQPLYLGNPYSSFLGSLPKSLARSRKRDSYTYPFSARFPSRSNNMRFHSSYEVLVRQALSKQSSRRCFSTCSLIHA